MKKALLSVKLDAQKILIFRMDNQASSDIVNLDSSNEVTPVEVEIAPLNAGQPATESDVGSHFKDMSWRDGAEVLADAADFIPGLGSLIKASVGLGDYSPEARLKEKQFKWVIQKVAEISHKIDILLQKLPPDEQIEAADVAAIINATMKASEKTADAKKRKLLKNAVVNAFDIEQYQAGLTLRLFSILEDVEYGDIVTLRQISEATSDVKFNHNGKSTKIDIKHEGSMIHHHIKVLEKLDLIKNNGRSNSYKEPSNYFIVMNKIGEKLLNFISSPKRISEKY